MIRRYDRRHKIRAIYLGVSQIYTPRHSVHLHYPCISVHPPSPSPSPSSLYLRSPAIAQSCAKLSGGGGEKRIFLPQRCGATTITLCSMSLLETVCSSLPSSSSSSVTSSASSTFPFSVSSSVKSLPVLSSATAWGPSSTPSFALSSTEAETVFSHESPRVLAQQCLGFWRGPGGPNLVLFHGRLNVPDRAREGPVCVQCIQSFRPWQ